MAELERVTSVLTADVSSYRRGMQQAVDSTREMERVVDRATDGMATDLNQAGAAFQRAGTQAQQAAGRMATSVSQVGRVSGKSRVAIQQLGFQVGDVATQISMGTSAITAFSVQGSQMLQVFGPVGAILGAAVAVLGGLAVGFMNAGDAARGAGRDIKDTINTISGLEGALGDLNQVVEAYADAISGTADAQVSASDMIVAQTQREFNAKKSLLELEQKRAMIQQSENLIRITDLRGRVSDLSRPTDLDSLVAQEVAMQEQALASARGLPSVTLPPGEVEVIRQMVSQGQFAEQEAARKRALEESSDDLKELGANASLLGIKLNNVSDALSLTFDDAVTQAQANNGGSGGGGGGGGSSRSRPNDPFNPIRQRISLLRQEQSMIGRTADVQEWLTIQYERQRIVTEALNKIKAEGREATPEEIAQAEQLGKTFEKLAIRNLDLAKSYKDAAQSAEEAKERQDAFIDSLAETADRLIGAAESADTFGEALQNMGLELAKILIMGAGGEGPLGGILGPLVKGIFAPAVTTLAGLPSNGLGPGTGGVYAKGAAFHAGRVIPFARGGVVDRPAIFPMARGIGLMGEAGPEAVMPLSRGPDGRLGVTGSGTTVNVTVENNAGADVSVRERQTPRGPDIRIMVDQATAANLSRGQSHTRRALSGVGSMKVR